MKQLSPLRRQRPSLLTLNPVALGFASAGLLLSAVAAPASEGEAILRIMANNDQIQKSNYGKNSFILRNTGAKTIVRFELDVTEALFPDTVFDPEGVAGDSVAKPLQINRDRATGIRQDDKTLAKAYIGEGGAAGYEGLRLHFDPREEDGFNPGETLGFSIDMDPNSIAGSRKQPLDASSVPSWDVGGVSGAELIGSAFLIEFADGSVARGRLFATGTQAGAHGIAREHHTPQKAELTANGIEPGGSGRYGSGGPAITVEAEAGQTVRVVLAKGFIQPVTAYNAEIESQLEALRQADFPANNAVEFQFVDLVMTGEPIDISNRFDFSGVADYDFSASAKHPFSVDEDKVSLALTAAVIDPDQADLPLGPPTRPIYLTFE